MLRVRMKIDWLINDDDDKNINNKKNAYPKEYVINDNKTIRIWKDKSLYL